MQWLFADCSIRVYWYWGTYRGIIHGLTYNKINNKTYWEWGFNSHPHEYWVWHLRPLGHPDCYWTRQHWCYMYVIKLLFQLYYYQWSRQGCTWMLLNIHENLITTNCMSKHPTVQTVTDNTNVPYNWPAFLAVNNRYTSLYALTRIHY